MASRHAESKAFIVHAWCAAEGVTQTVGGWHQWDWYSTRAQAETQATRTVNTRWIGKDGTKYGRFETFELAGEENGR